MFYNAIKDFPDLIAAYAVTKFEKFGTAVSLVAQIELSDHSILHVKDYLFVDGTRKYAYHWQDATGQLRMRWDNSPHHQYIATFPHHKHLFSDVVTESQERNLRDVLEAIRQTVANEKELEKH